MTFMEEAAKRLRELLEFGKTFDYDNFSLKTVRGNVSACSADWLSWTKRTSNIIERVFDADSAPVEMIKFAKGVILIGNNITQFKAAHSYYLKALEDGIAALDSDIFYELSTQKSGAVAPKEFSNKVFVVHGRDENAAQELEIILGRMGLEPVVLHRQPDLGKVLIEKFEYYADVGYAFILMTPDEIAYLVNEDAKLDKERDKQLRARPNVIFEFGFFVGKLGRRFTCCILRGDVAIPSDLNGLVYKRFSSSIREIAYDIQEELKVLGYKLR